MVEFKADKAIYLRVKGTGSNITMTQKNPRNKSDTVQNITLVILGCL